MQNFDDNIKNRNSLPFKEFISTLLGHPIPWWQVRTNQSRRVSKITAAKLYGSSKSSSSCSAYRNYPILQIWSYAPRGYSRGYKKKITFVHSQLLKTSRTKRWPFLLRYILGRCRKKMAAHSTSPVLYGRSACGCKVAWRRFDSVRWLRNFLGVWSKSQGNGVGRYSGSPMPHWRYSITCTTLAIRAKQSVDGVQMLDRFDNMRLSHFALNLSRRFIGDKWK